MNKRLKGAIATATFAGAAYGGITLVDHLRTSGLDEVMENHPACGDLSDPTIQPTAGFDAEIQAINSGSCANILNVVDAGVSNNITYLGELTAREQFSVECYEKYAAVDDIIWRIKLPDGHEGNVVVSDDTMSEVYNNDTPGYYDINHYLAKCALGMTNPLPAAK